MPKNVFSVNDKGQINLSIDSFYERYPLEEQFDEVFYSNKYEDHVKDYYQPYCKNNGFTEKQRLYHHWVHYGKDDLLLPYENYEDVTKIYDANIINEDISIVVSCKDREDMLSVSLRSWLLKPQIKEIIIVDWSSKKSLTYLEKEDDRIKVIRVEGEEFYNASKPINLAIKSAKYEKILKMDVDYILNPYVSLNSLVDIKKGEFIAGNWHQYYLDNDLGFIRNLNGIICCHKKFFIDAGLYNEEIDNYGREDCEMFEKLEKLGVIRKDIYFAPNDVVAYHNPHSNRVRGYNRKNSDIDSTLTYMNRRYGQSDFELVINLYKDPLPERTKEILDCLKLNLENKYITKVHIFLENYEDFPEFYELKKDYEEKTVVNNTIRRMSFKKIFDYTNKNIVNTQCIVANNDILFNEDLSKIRGMVPRDIISLTRHEEDGKLLENRHRKAVCSADAWIFRSPMVENFEELPDDIIVGTFYSDVILNYYIAKSRQYCAWNVCNDVIIKHCHQTTKHDHNTKSIEEAEAVHLAYVKKFQKHDWYKHLAITNIEDYWNLRKANKFISDHQFDLNNY
tara:strand:+ start:1376 stop:3070 length:1695 start_codon:yes stop_codon:yes gene_type:complete